MNSHGLIRRRPYNGRVDTVGFPKLARAALAALFAFALAAVTARADSGTDITMPAANAPVIHLQMRSGTLILHAWNQPQVHIASTSPVTAQHFGSIAVQRALRGGDIPIFSTTVQSPQGAITLPAEDFSAGSLAAGDHDGVTILGGDANATVTLTVPSNTALVWAVIGRGGIQMQDYHAGSFVERVHNGSITVQNVSGEGYMEVARGRILAEDSTFDRIRARTAIGNIVFRGCNARQIEVSSVNGNIAYDDGQFGAGLARFESQKGNVAIGVSGGGVQIGAHSGGGKIFQGFDQPADIRGNATDAQAVVGGGGPVVTASSDSGSVFLYNGRLAAHPDGRVRFRLVGRPPQRQPNRRRKIP